MSTSKKNTALPTIRDLIEIILQKQHVREHLQRAALQEQTFQRKLARDREDATVHEIMSRMASRQKEEKHVTQR